MDKYYAQEKQVFDINKVTVVGSPTITSDGVASGFSSSNYIRLEQGLLTNANIWELEFDYDATDIPDNTVGTIFQNVQTSPTYSGLVIQGRNYVLTLYAGSGSGTTWDVISSVYVPIQYKAFNKIRLGYNGTKYYCFVNGVEKWSLISDVKIGFPNGNSVVGYHHWWAALQYGSIDLKQFKIYVDGELVYSPTKPVYALERRKPKVWNKGQFEVVGNPSISDSGVASGFSSSNYLTIPSIDMSQPWEGHIDFSTTTLGTASGYLGWGNTEQDNGLVLSSAKWLSFRTIVGQINSDVLKDNTKYSCIIGWSGTQYYLKILEYGTNEWKTKTTNSTTPNSSVDTTVKIGWFKSQFPCLNSLNLKTIKFYQNNNLVFDGGAETYVYDASKFTVVGSPTITSDGVASGFSAGNYLTISQLLGSGSWRIKCGFKTSNDITTQQILFNNNGASDGVRIGFVAGNSFRYVVRGVNGNIVNYSIPISNFNTQTDYIAEIAFTGTQYICSLNNVVVETVNSTELVIDGNKWTIGKFSTNNLPFLGSIDLPSVSITVDGKEVFTGAKEKFYAMRRM